MARKTLDVKNLLSPDTVATQIANYWVSWDQARNPKKEQWAEVRNYIYATDTRSTSNNQLPWKNSTHIPKLCQIRDNLTANYLATIFPKRRWLKWEGDRKQDQYREKVETIKDYMQWTVSQREFKDEIIKLVSDYIDYGNCFATVEWVDETTQGERGIEKVAFVGPRPVRINPLDIVFDPTAASFASSPKIIRSLMSLGEAKRYLEQNTVTEEDKKIASEVWNYMREIRQTARGMTDLVDKDNAYRVDGFGSFRDYLSSETVELLTFYGDFYDVEKDILFKNQMVVVADRHKVFMNQQHPLPTGNLPIFHAGWRIRQDNLWAMGPLDNLVGMQYRIDHVENLKADLFDLTVFPPLKIKGIVQDFEWGPFERIFVDQDGDVELMAPRVEILTANIEIQTYEQRMEEMAGAPKEAMGFRTPGEKTMYEVQRLENAASRIFTSKTSQFEEQLIEPILNAMLALARNNLTTATIRAIDDEYKSVLFREITNKDLSALGKLKPVAARHFAEKAELVQNLTSFFQGPIGSDPEIKAHFSTVKLAKMFEEIFDIEDFETVQDFVRLTEQAEAQKQINVMKEEVGMHSQTPAGIMPDDFTGQSLPPELMGGA